MNITQNTHDNLSILGLVLIDFFRKNIQYLKEQEFISIWKLESWGLFYNIILTPIEKDTFLEFWFYFWYLLKNSKSA